MFIFFKKIDFIVNIVSTSCKHNDKLQVFQATKIEHWIAVGKIEMDKEANQVSDLQLSLYIKWSSRFKLICCLIKMCGATSLVLNKIASD